MAFVVVNPHEWRETIRFILFMIKGFRFVKLFTSRVGHLLINTLFLVNDVPSDLMRKEKIIVVFPPKSFELEKVSNQYLLGLWKRYFIDNNIPFVEAIFPLFILRFLPHDRRVIESDITELSTKDFYLSVDTVWVNAVVFYNSFGRLFQHGFTSPLQEYHAYQSPKSILQKYDIDKKQYVCTFTRDDMYLKTLYPGQLFSYHDYRDDEYTKLLPFVDYLSKKDISSVRVGNIKKNLSPSIFSRTHIDYLSENKDGFDDVAILSSCLFYLGDTSGIAVIPHFFGVPVARYNWVPIFNSLPCKTLMIPMLVKDQYTNQYVSFRRVHEIMAELSLSPWRSSSYDDAGLMLVKNTAEDIYELGCEMIDRIDDDYNFKTKTYNQYRFEKMMLSIGYHYPGLIGSKFIDKYRELFL